MPEVVHTSEDLDGTIWIWFFCPGCRWPNAIVVKRGSKYVGPCWDWNQDKERPTLSPSILSRGEHRCHSFIRDGKIQYLGDCEHELKGTTVDLPAWDTWKDLDGMGESS
jgi:hypothetical protein